MRSKGNVLFDAGVRVNTNTSGSNVHVRRDLDFNH